LRFAEFRDGAAGALSRLEDALRAMSSLRLFAARRLSGICAEDLPHWSEHARGNLRHCSSVLFGSSSVLRGRSARGLIASLATSRSVGRQEKERLTMVKALLPLAVASALAAAPLASVGAHEIYTGVHGKNGQLCCGGDDCAATVYRERGGTFEFLTREREWVAIPEERITFLPIPGDPPSEDTHHAHLCYRPATEYDRQSPASSNVFESIFLYCAFIPPGSI
jgi:hypothetical protein